MMQRQVVVAVLIVGGAIVLLAWTSSNNGPEIHYLKNRSQAGIPMDQDEKIRPAVPAGCPADANGDGKVDGIDISFVRAAIGTKVGDPEFKAMADMDSNGYVDTNDIERVRSNLGCQK